MQLLASRQHWMSLLARPSLTCPSRNSLDITGLHLQGAHTPKAKSEAAELAES